MAAAAAVWHGILSLNRLHVVNLSTSSASRRRDPRQQFQCPTHSQIPLHHHVLPVLSLPLFHRRSPVCSLAAASAYDEALEEDEEEEGEEGEEELEEEEKEKEEEELKAEEGEYEDEDVEEKRRLFVGNLPYTTTASKLGEIFQEAGQVDSVEIIYDRVTDRSRGFAFVNMGSFAEAKEAIRLFDGSQLRGRTLKVNFPEVPRGGEREIVGPKLLSSSRGYVESAKKVYAGNLSWNVTSEGLKEVFGNQPGLLGAKVIYERDSGRSRGYGFVAFSSLEEAQAALDAMNGVELEGRPLRLSMAYERPPRTTQETEADSVGYEMQTTVLS